MHRKILAGENLANYELANIHRYTENVLAYTLTVAYSPNFSLPIAFAYMVCQNFPVYSNVCWVVINSLVDL